MELTNAVNELRDLITHVDERIKADVHNRDTTADELAQLDLSIATRQRLRTELSATIDLIRANERDGGPVAMEQMPSPPPGVSPLPEAVFLAAQHLDDRGVGLGTVLSQTDSSALRTVLRYVSDRHNGRI